MCFEFSFIAVVVRMRSKGNSLTDTDVFAVYKRGEILFGKTAMSGKKNNCDVIEILFKQIMIGGIA